MNTNALSRRYAYFVACFLLACGADAAPPGATRYRCIGEQATGFAITKKSHAWAVQRFRQLARVRGSGSIRRLLAELGAKIFAVTNMTNIARHFYNPADRHAAVIGPQPPA